MDQSEADWGDWSLNNDGGLNQVDAEVKQELVDDEQRLTAYDEEPQKDAVEFRMYDDDGGLASASGESDASDFDDLEDGGELQKELLSRTERGPLGQLQPQGMVMCEFCGRLGVRDAFYSKTKRFCSVNCSKSFATAQKEGKPTPFTLLQASMAQGKRKGTHGNLKSQYVGHGGVKFGSGHTKAFDWSSYMNQTHANAAPVSCFKHCLMSDSWDNIAVGMKVEVINKDCDLETEAYWIATVIQLAGYRAQMRYEGFGNDASLDFWMNLCSRDIHPVGWCAANGKPLVPPNTIIHKYLDWKDFLVKRLTGARTLPQNFYTKVQECLNNTPIKKGMFVEVVDKMCVSAMRVARVEDIIGGRLKLLYLDSKVENDEFWCHQESPLVHPVGWSQHVGHKLHCTPEYKTESLTKVTNKKYDENDSTPDMFIKRKDLPGGGKFQVGMKLEAIDPLNLSSICVASVAKVLRNNYLMIGIDGSIAQNGTDWFCYHASSPCIFPVGFCEINNLDISPPRDHKSPFKWFDYLKETKSAAAPVKLFDKSIPRHGFKLGMKLEAVDLMEPRLICVATVRRVVGRLLRIHFDGWENGYDQWIDCHSADIYPVGWCEMVDYHLEGPRPKSDDEPSQPHILALPKKRKSKSQIYRGPRKKRKPKLVPVTPGKPGPRTHQNSLDSSDISQDSFSTAMSDSLTGRVIVKEEVLDPYDKENPSKTTSMTSDTSTLAAEASPANHIDGLVHGTEPTGPGTSPQRVPHASSKSMLASSMPSITNILNSPVTPQPVPGNFSLPVQGSTPSISPQYKSPAISLKTGTAASTPSGTLSPSLSPTNPHVFTVQKVQGHSSVYTLSSPTSSPGGNPVQVTQVFTHNIPRVIPGEPDQDCVPPVVVNKTNTILPDKWGVSDVCQFLKINDSAAQSDCFRKRNIDGLKFLALSKEQIVNLTGMKVGPSLKIFDLIQALKSRVTQQNRCSMSAMGKSQEGGENPGTQVTASVLLKQQGLLQQQPPSSQEQDTVKELGASGGQRLSQHLLNKTSSSMPQHSLALKAQLTQ